MQPDSTLPWVPNRVYRRDQEKQSYEVLARGLGREVTVATVAAEADAKYIVEAANMYPHMLALLRMIRDNPEASLSQRPAWQALIGHVLR
jgi:hypothetical protein